MFKAAFLPYFIVQGGLCIGAMKGMWDEFVKTRRPRQ